MTTHLTNARVAAPTSPQHQEDTTDAARLLSLWCERTAAVAAAAAHHPRDEQRLFALQQEVEKALRARSAESGRVLDNLIWWECTLIHHAEEVPAEHCLICKRARADAAGLPTWVKAGGAL